jgi:hypothetical protein
VTSVMMPILSYILVTLVMIVGVGFPIGMILRRRILDNHTLLLLVALVSGVALDLILYYQLFTWCYSLEHMGPFSVSCSNFLNEIYATIPIGILGAISMIFLTKRKRD